VSTSSGDPFRGVVSEITLPHAPLAKVLAQLRYPRPLDFNEITSIEPASRALASRYPVGRQAKATAVIITSSGLSQEQTAETNWIFEDIDANWKVTIADRFVALETIRYSSRDDFTARFTEIVHIISESLRPPVFDRLGIRYINRLEGEDVAKDLPRLVQPVALAGLAVPHEGIQIEHSLCDSIFVDGNAHLQVRWGWLPAGAAIDLTVSAPAVPYWLLDIDSFTGKGGPFDLSVLDNTVSDLAERAHRFFRWLVTEDFLLRFGGEI